MSTRLAELLLAKNAVTRDQLEEAMQAQVCGRTELGIQEGDFLGRTLVLLGYVKPREIMRLIVAAQGKKDHLLLSGWPVDLALASAIPEESALACHILPLIHLSGHLPMVLSGGPLPQEARQELCALLKVDVDDLPAPEESVDALARQLYASLRARPARSGLGEILLREGLLSRNRLEDAVQAARREDLTLAEYLVRERLVDEEKVYRSLAASAHLPYVAAADLAKLKLSLDLVRRAQPEYVRTTRAMPISVDAERLTVVTVDPYQDIGALAHLVDKVRVIERVVTSYSTFAGVFKEAFSQKLAEWLEDEAGPRASFQPLTNARFREAVIAAGCLSAQEYDDLRQDCNGDDLAVLDHLHREELVSKDTLGKLWGDSLGLAYLNLDKTLIQEEVVKLLPEEFARAHKVVLVYEFFGTITAAMPQPDVMVARKIGELVGRTVEAVFSLPAEIQAAIELFYQSESEIKELASKLAILDVSGDGSFDLEALRQSAGSEGVVSFTEGVLLLAMKERASDIHVEPTEDAVRIRFRIDGHLQERFVLRRNVLPPLISRLKILAGVDIIERRLPQDGRISLRLGDRLMDFRFSTTPAIHGEKAVMRVLGQLQRQTIPELKDLLFSKGNLEKLLGLLARPNGIFFVTGPGEEIFWRGFLQGHLMEKWGDSAGYLATTVIYAGVHVFSWNLILILAALVAGAFWGILYLWKRDLLVQITSHSFWSAVIFAVAPIQ
ncbi:MAG: ATPase, T2SS/T4P/T4SS family [Planctomycetota bacterium]